MSFDKELLQEAEKHLGDSQTTDTATSQVADTNSDAGDSRSSTDVVADTDTSAGDNTATTDANADTTNTTADTSTAAAKKEWFDEDEPVISAPISANPAENSQSATQSTTKQEPVKDPVLEHPIVQEVIAVMKGDGDPVKLLEALGGTDPAKLSPEDLYNIKLNRLNLTPEERDEAIAEFEAMPAFKKKEITQPIAQELDKSRKEKLDQLTAPARDRARLEQEAAQKIGQEVEAVASGYVGKDYCGLTITQEVANKAKHDFFNTNFRKPDGSLDVDRVFKLMVLEANIKNIVKTNVTRAKNESLGQVVNTLTKPDANTTVRTPVIQGRETVEEEAKRLHEQELKTRGIQ